MNPQTEDADLKVGSLYFRVGDKVMQNRNSGKASNGDIGFIRSFRHDERDGMRIAIQFSPMRVVSILWKKWVMSSFALHHHRP